MESPRGRVSSRNLDLISFDEFANIASNLSCSDVTRLLMTCKKLYKMKTDERLWLSVLADNSSKAPRRSLVQQVQLEMAQSTYENSCQNFEMCRMIEGLEKMDRVNVSEMMYVHANKDQDDDFEEIEVPNGFEGIVDKMEGHTASQIFNRYCIVVGAWGPKFSNNVYTMDLRRNIGDEEEYMSTNKARGGGGGGSDRSVDKGVADGDFSATSVTGSAAGGGNDSTQGNIATERKLFATTNNQMVACRVINTETVGLPDPFIYGFSTCTLADFNDTINCNGGTHSSEPSSPSALASGGGTSSPKPFQNTKRLLVFGGCTEGGYGGDTNAMYFIDLEFRKAKTDLSCASKGVTLSDHEIINAPQDADASGKVDRVIATYSSNVTAPDVQLPRTRAYHTANVLDFNGAISMIVFGGLREHSPVNDLEIYNVENNAWSLPLQQGQSPSPRFGHSGIYHKDSDSVIYCSGSDGSDLTRNGVELRDIHILSIVRGNAAAGEEDKLVWSSPTFEQGLKVNLPGRCHNAALYGDKIFYFGGSARNSRDMCVYDIKTQTPQIKPEVYVSSTTKKLPHPRVSSAGVLIGKHFIVQGGWSNNRKELGDLWSIDLSYSTSEDLIRNASGNKVDGSAMEEKPAQVRVSNDRQMFQMIFETLRSQGYDGDLESFQNLYLQNLLGGSEYDDDDDDDEVEGNGDDDDEDWEDVEDDEDEEDEDVEGSEDIKDNGDNEDGESDEDKESKEK